MNHVEQERKRIADQISKSYSPDSLEKGGVGSGIRNHVKQGLEQHLGRKISMSYVDRGMGDKYHQFDVEPGEKEKVHDYFKSHPNNKKIESKYGGTYNTDIGYIDHESGKAQLINPARNRESKVGIKFDD